MRVEQVAKKIVKELTELDEEVLRKLWKMYLEALADYELEQGSDAHDCDKILGDIPLEEALTFVCELKSDPYNTQLRQLYEKHKKLEEG